MENLLFYFKYAVPCFSHYVSSNQYVDYICNKIIPKHQQIQGDDGQPKDNFCLLAILQALGEATAYVQPTVTTHPIDLPHCEKIVFAKLLSYLPEVRSDDSPVEYKFDHLEPLLFAFHNLGKKNGDEIINDIGGDEVFKDFKKRLQQLGLSCQERIKTLQTTVRSISDKPTSPKSIALKCVQNIQAIIKDMFYLKPVFKVSLAHSWKFGLASTVVSLNKSATQSTTAPAATNGNGVSSDPPTASKRKLITAPEKDPNEVKKQKIYSPPSGKFSGKGNFRSKFGLSLT